MAVLNVLRFPDERLRTVAKEITQVDDTIKTLIEDMLETMYDENGVGLAATQVDQHVRMFVLDVSENGAIPHAKQGLPAISWIFSTICNFSSKKPLESRRDGFQLSCSRCWFC